MPQNPALDISGNTCAGYTVEIFSSNDTDGEGKTFIGYTTATTGGDFSLTVSYLRQPYLTATATDAADGTSEFSGVFAATVPILYEINLPLLYGDYP